MAMITGGELLVRTLAKAKVKTIFGIHGAHLESIFQASTENGISIVDVRHEAAGGHAAEGYARTTGKLGVAVATAGPGFTNLVSSIANACLDRTPVLYISGSPALRDAETNTLQAGVDQVAIAKPITKWAHQITLTSQIPRLVAHAIRVASSAPSGPVLLNIPSDVLDGKIDEDSVEIPQTIYVNSVAAPAEHALAAALDLLSKAERPVIMVGTGAWLAHASAPLRAFVAASGIPVFSDFQGLGLLPGSDRLFGGTFHKMADLAEAGGRPDVVLALGVRFGLFTLGGGDKLVPRDAKVIHVEVDPIEIGRLRPVALPIVADPAETLRSLSRLGASHAWPDWGDWQATVYGARIERQRRFAAEFHREAPPIHPYQAVAAIADAIPPDAIVIGDGAEAYHWFNETIQRDQPGSYLAHGFLGCMGIGLGLSVGAQAGSPDRPVLCLTGDGSVGFNISEFDTMARHNLPIVVVVMNNQSWAASQHYQEIVSGANRLLGTTLVGARYHDVAAGFGCSGALVTELAQLAPAIEAAFASKRPTCINVIIDVVPIPPELYLLMSQH